MNLTYVTSNAESCSDYIKMARDKISNYCEYAKAQKSGEDMVSPSTVINLLQEIDNKLSEASMFSHYVKEDLNEELEHERYSNKLVANNANETTEAEDTEEDNTGIIQVPIEDNNEELPFEI